LILTYSKR